ESRLPSAMARSCTSPEPRNEISSRPKLFASRRSIGRLSPRASSAPAAAWRRPRSALVASVGARPSTSQDNRSPSETGGCETIRAQLSREQQPLAVEAGLALAGGHEPQVRALEQAEILRLPRELGVAACATQR